MARITLKVTKSAASSATPKPLSSRAKRAQLQSQRHKPSAPPVVVAEPAPAAPVAAPAVRSERRTPAGAARPKRGFDARGQSAAVAPSAHAQVERRPRTDRGKRRPAAAAGTTQIPRAPAEQNRERPPRHEKPDDPRLSKRMSEMGLCSRREADEWIEKGWVKVDGKVVDVLGTRVSPFASIEVDEAAAQHQSEQVTILLNKPIGYVSGQAEEGHTPASVLITPENRWADDPSDIRFKPAHLRGLAPAGRLDVDSTGLIVFTQDGRVAKRLIGSHSEVEKEYLVRVEGKLDAAGMKLLQHGLELDGVKLKPARVSWQNEDQLRFVLREGRKRQIRRMCELVGLTVTGLKRVRSGSVSLGPLPVGRWRYLRSDERF